MVELEIMEFAKRLKHRRQTLDLSQQEVAKMTGISQVQISNYELGNSQPTATAIIALARALKTSSDWLLGLNEGSEEGLSEREVEILRLFRSKSPDGQSKVIEVARII